jgi:D-amino-acid oxidase
VTCYAQQRPRRNGGYLLRVDTHDNRILVHNYGHGGAGVSLAPGCAIEAVQLAKRALPHIPSAAVVGCGVIGLFTCRELLRQCPGVQVRVYASRLPRFGEKENGRLITSQVAPGLWFPFHYGR